MMRRVQVRVPRLRMYEAGTSFEVFGDLGEGLIDFDHPLSPRPLALWREAARQRGHVLDGHLSGRHLDGVSPDGHLEGEHLTAEHLWPAVAVVYETPAYVFGRFQHAVRMRDGSGNVSGESVSAVTINSAPTVPGCVTRSGYDAINDIITFSFEPSRFEPISGK